MTTWNISLYLDIYLNGKRTYEYLKMYLIPEQTRADREKNKETLKTRRRCQGETCNRTQERTVRV
ncbi:MAG: Arm DNA-binding domain-containing protein [Bacteroidales bacterium]|nr:Arm DNA-binding domain-containing protein [Bacteroidales bacterium]